MITIGASIGCTKEARAAGEERIKLIFAKLCVLNGFILYGISGLKTPARFSTETMQNARKVLVTIFVSIAIPHLIKYEYTSGTEEAVASAIYKIHCQYCHPSTVNCQLSSVNFFNWRDEHKTGEASGKNG